MILSLRRLGRLRAYLRRPQHGPHFARLTRPIAAIEKRKTAGSMRGRRRNAVVVLHRPEMLTTAAAAGFESTGFAPAAVRDTRVRKLLQACGLCLQMTGSRFSVAVQTSASYLQRVRDAYF